MKKYIAELVGTFALVFCGTGAIIINDASSGAITHIGIALTFGAVILAMIYSIGEISGAHLNPAVTISFFVGGLFPKKDVIPYIFSQILGGLIASITLHFLFPANVLLGSTMPAGSELQSFVLEGILTFFLMFVILGVSQGSKEIGVLAGIAIGTTIMMDAMFGGPISGASMNPARSLAPALVSGHLEHLWLYIVAPVIGALVALFVWKVIRNQQR